MSSNTHFSYLLIIADAHDARWQWRKKKETWLLMMEAKNLHSGKNKVFKSQTPNVAELKERLNLIFFKFKSFRNKRCCYFFLSPSLPWLQLSDWQTFCSPCVSVMDANTRGVTVWRRALNREQRQLFLCAATAQSWLYSPYTNSTYSALLVPRWLLASQRYVPLSVLFSVVMVSSLPSTIMRSMSGSSPPSLNHSTGSGLEIENIQVFLTVLRLNNTLYIP